MTQAERNKKEVHICRVLDYNGNRFWIMFDETNELKSSKTESKNQLIRRWRQKHGDIGILTRFKGICKPSEMVACISSVRERSNNR